VVWSQGYTSAQTNVTVDVVGYFAKPQAQALDCIWTADGTISVPPNATIVTEVSSPACPSGYAVTGGRCFNGGFNYNYEQNSRYGSNTWICGYTNVSASAQTIAAAARCCRTPGR
jgi:hypothetical protein